MISQWRRRPYSSDDCVFIIVRQPKVWPERAMMGPTIQLVDYDFTARQRVIFRPRDDGFHLAGRQWRARRVDRIRWGQWDTLVYELPGRRNQARFLQWVWRHPAYECVGFSSPIESADSVARIARNLV